MKTPAEAQQKLEKAITTILGMLSVEAVVSVEPLDDAERSYFSVDISAENNTAELIGRYGNTLESLTTVVNAIMASGSKDESWRVVIDVNGYRKERAEYVESVTKRAIEQVMEGAGPITLNPMKPWERRIVHMLVSQHSDLQTTSIGDGADRHVVIELAK